MTFPHDTLDATLPLSKLELLRKAIGRTLLEIERRFVEQPDDYVTRAGEGTEYFARASGLTEFMFSDSLVHSLAVWPSALSITVHSSSAAEDPYAEPVRLSRVGAPSWLFSCLGCKVLDVRVYVYREDAVDSPEPRQVAVSYVLAPDIELVYCTYLHGRMDGDELVLAAEIDPSRVASVVSVAAAAQ